MPAAQCLQVLQRVVDASADVVDLVGGLGASGTIAGDRYALIVVTLQDLLTQVAPVGGEF